MTRILADIPDDDIKWFDETAVALGRSRSSLVCEAIEFICGPSKPKLPEENGK